MKKIFEQEYENKFNLFNLFRSVYYYQQFVHLEYIKFNFNFTPDF